MAKLQSPAENMITETRKLLTKLEFVAMEISNQNDEKNLTAILSGIKRDTESAAKQFGAI